MTADNDLRVSEQAHLDRLYARLDRMRSNTNRRLSDSLRETDGTPQALSERESYERMYTEDLTKLDAAEHNLYFGRLDMDPDPDADEAGIGEIRRIGRIGVLDDDDQDSTLLLDWRAPMARPFYLATPASREDVHIRRHVRTRNRKVTAVNSEVLASVSATDSESPTAAHGDVVNESALIDALNTARTGHMSDIVETIQREQDLIIRSPHRGVMVVQGGPGTGKTAVALHRAAYLLYTYRDTLSRSGVLIIGPNSVFLNYIGQVLPSLGESGVLLSTIGNLYPGVTAVRPESRATAAIKGDLRMVEVMKQAVRDREILPGHPIEVRFDGYPLRIDNKLIRKARGRARSSRRTHNVARPIFLRAAFDELAAQHAARIGTSTVDGSQLLSGSDIAEIRNEMREDPAIVRELDRCWPLLTPERVLADLFASPDRITAATPDWSEQDRELLHRTRSENPATEFAASDAPLLDELAEIIGIDDDDERQQQEWRRKIAEAQEALDILTGSAPQDLEDELDPEILMAYDLIDAEQLAQRQVRRTSMTTAERAYSDRTWTFGHVVIDEAQELSPMAWRMIMRRIPNRWMTVIGDTAQTGDLAGTTSWNAVLEPYVAKRWRQFDLTVNYRTPAEIMAVAAPVLAAIDPDLPAPESIRSTGRKPVWREVWDTDEVADTAVTEATADLDDGICAIIVPDAMAGTISTDDERICVLTVGECKGLEFDRTVVVEPAAIVGQTARGLSDLYVALTRATQDLVVVHAEPLPDVLVLD